MVLATDVSAGGSCNWIVMDVAAVVVSAAALSAGSSYCPTW